jgi:hypothetical protein
MSVRRKFTLIDLVLIMAQEYGQPFVGRASVRSTSAFLQSALQ